MSKQRALDKIKKCLALSKSANSNEAATALRMAQALMRQHGLTLEEVALSEVATESVKTRETPTGGNYLVQLCGLIQSAFGVRALIVQGRPGTTARVEYVGPRHRVAPAAYAHTVIDRAISTSWRRFKKECPWLCGRGSRLSFRRGFLHAVSVNVEAFAMSDEEKQMTENALSTVSSKPLSPRKPPRVSMDAAAAGMEAAEGFTLSRPIETQRKELTHE